MSRLTPSLRLDLLEAMVDALDAFLSSSDLTRVVPVKAEGQMHRPAMSLGLLLDELHALSAPDSGLNAEQGARLERLRRALADARGSRPRDFDAHLSRELSSQLRAWDRFVEDLADDPKAAGAAPASELARRSRIERLMESAGPGDEVDALRRRLATIDRRFERLSGGA